MLLFFFPSVHTCDIRTSSGILCHFYKPVCFFFPFFTSFFSPALKCLFYPPSSILLADQIFPLIAKQRPWEWAPWGDWAEDRTNLWSQQYFTISVMCQSWNNWCCGTTGNWSWVMTFARAGATLTCVSVATCHYFFFTFARGAAVILRNLLVIDEGGRKKNLLRK